MELLLKRISLMNKRKTKVIKPKKLRKERTSVKLKLILSHSIIAAVPLLIIATVLTTQASSALLGKVNSSKQAYVTKVIKIIDGNIQDIENVSKIIISDKGMNDVIKKNTKDYKNSFDKQKDRNDNFYNKINSLQYSNKMITRMFC